MKLFLLRHAESIGNASGNYSTAMADALSPHGTEQADALARALQSFEFEHIVASPLQRTLETIAPYLTATARRAELWPEITEACWHEEREAVSGAWDSVPASLPDGLAEQFRFRDDVAVQPAHPQTFGEGLRRAHDARDRVRRMAEAGHRSLLMVSHAHFIRELMMLILDIGTPIQIEHDNCGITLLSFDGTWCMEFSNRTVHVLPARQDG